MLTLMLLIETATMTPTDYYEKLCNLSGAISHANTQAFVKLGPKGHSLSAAEQREYQRNLDAYKKTSINIWDFIPEPDKTPATAYCVAKLRKRMEEQRHLPLFTCHANETEKQCTEAISRGEKR